jgi:CII-binding regulator of phage lambda lysogenization HflD
MNPSHFFIIIALIALARMFWLFRKHLSFNKLFFTHTPSPEEFVEMVKNLTDGLNKLSESLNSFNNMYADQLQYYKREIEALHLEIGQNLRLIAKMSDEVDTARGELLINEFLKKDLLAKITDLTKRFDKLESEINKNFKNKES